MYSEKCEICGRTFWQDQDPAPDVLRCERCIKTTSVTGEPRYPQPGDVYLPTKSGEAVSLPPREDFISNRYIQVSPLHDGEPRAEIVNDLAFDDDGSLGVIAPPESDGSRADGEFGTGPAVPLMGDETEFG